MRRIGRDLEDQPTADQPTAAQPLRTRARRSGIQHRSALALPLANPHSDQLLVELMQVAKVETRAQRKEALEREAARRELDAKEHSARDRWMSLG